MRKGLFMNKLGRMLSVVILVLIFAVLAPAQMGTHSGPPGFHGVWNPVVGQGGVYEFSSKDGGTQKMEMAVVGKDMIDGKEAFWYQVVMDIPHGGGQSVTKHLMVRDGQETHTIKIIMQFPGQPPMEMPAQMSQHQHAKQSADISTEAQDIGSESITVPAGTFTAEHYRMNDGSGDTWVAKNISPYGLVKYQGKDATIVLVKVVTDAKDKIVGKPVPFNPQSFMQQPPQ
jgi:hypothetical protein